MTEQINLSSVKKEFWLELARLEGIRYSPRNRPLRWGRYVMMFVYDAVDPDVGRELRKINPDPHFLKNHHMWISLAAIRSGIKSCKLFP